jgi:hypothetical protein
MSDETKAKISMSNTGKKRSSEARQNMSNAHKGKIISEEQRKKISDANSGSNNHFYGKTHTQEELDKMSKTYTIISPDGEIMTITNMAEHCRKHNLNKKNMSSVINGKRLHHKGWKLFSL